MSEGGGRGSKWKGGGGSGLFGMPTPGSGSVSLFGMPAPGSGSAGLFGMPPAGSGSSGLFGMPAPGSGFFSAESKSTGTGAEKSTHVFGQSSGTSPFQSKISLFGVEGNPGSSQGNPGGSSLFSAKPSFGSDTNTPAVSGFGTEAGGSGSSFQTQPSALFAKPLTAGVSNEFKPSSFSAVAQESVNVFGAKLSRSENLFSKPKDSENLFSKPKDSENLFSKTKDSKNLFSNTKDSENLFSKPSDSLDLFLKPKNSENLFSQPKESLNLFSKPKDSETLFSKPVSSEKLFSKPISSENLFSKVPASNFFETFGSQDSGSSGSVFGGKTFSSSVPRTMFEPPDVTKTRPQTINQYQEGDEEGLDRDEDYEEQGEWNEEEQENFEEEFEEGEEGEDGEDGDDVGSDLDPEPEPEPQPEPQPETKPAVLPARKKLIRSFSKEELQTITSIICEEVPDVINNQITMTKHFSNFGTVTRVTSNLRQKTAIIHFNDHKSAKLAKEKGKVVSSKVPPIGHIFYSQISPGKGRIRRTTSRSEISDDAASVRGSTKAQFSSLPLKKKTFSITKALTSSEAESSDVIKRGLGVPVRKAAGGDLGVPAPKRRAAGGDLGIAAPIRRAVGGDLGVAAPIRRAAGGAELGELLNIMKSQANTDSDRYTVLEARDKYIRLKNPKSVTRSGLEIGDINLKGTCPDFCPEKERYSRSAKNLLRWFEKLDGALYHPAAIKEHSRSAADQDVPLSHELRPPSILSRTLDYLMCNIMDRIDCMSGTMRDWFRYVEETELQGLENQDPANNFIVNTTQENFSIGDWFEFVWSTTRGIRKDITQQNLADTVSVSLVEKCARFHIFCAERLCEEDAHDFAPKLNNENLTKCLQSLKHMYYDLSLENVECEREVEFRSYEILLNLNEGDTLREVQTLEENVRNHPSVVHALNIFYALNSNNYVRFFRLVKASTYLEMCILKRYFYQVRVKALEIMIKSFLAPKQILHYSLQKIVDLLLFESASECASFLRAHGVESEVDDDIVFMERLAFHFPETQPPMKRSQRLIDSKKTCSFGEIVNGAPLPQNPYLTYTPHSSFDAQGYLKPESYEAKDQVAKQSPEELSRLKAAEERKVRLQSYSTQVVEEITDEVSSAEIVKVAQSVLRDIRIQAEADLVYSRLETDTVKEEIVSICFGEIKESKNNLLLQRLEEEKEEEDILNTATDIMQNLILENIVEVAEQSLAESVQELKNAEQRHLAEELRNKIVEETVKDSLRVISSAALDDYKRELETKIQLLEKRFRNKLLSRCFKSWRGYSLRAKKQRQVISDFPAAPSLLSSSEQNTRLAGFSGSGSKRISISERQKNMMEYTALLKDAELKDSVLQNLILEPFNIPEMLQEARRNKIQRYSIGVKILLSSDNLSSDSEYYPLEQVIKRKFRKMFPVVPEDPDILVLRTVPFNLASLFICVRNITEENLKQSTFSESDRKTIFSGTTGVLFLDLDPENPSVDRLSSVLVNRPKIPPVPVLVLTHSSPKQFISSSQINKFKEDGYISEYEIYQLSSNIYSLESMTRILEGVRKLVQHQPEDPTQDLKKRNLRDFLEGFLTSQVFGEMSRNLKARRKLGLAHRPYQDLLCLFNHGLEHLKEVLMDPVLQEVSWPMPEFLRPGSDELPVNWNDALHVDETVQFIDSLKLEDLQVYEADSWRNLVEQIWAYVDRISVPNYDTSVLVSELRRSLSRSYRGYTEQCCRGGGGENITPPPEILPWTDILVCCAQYRLSCMEGSDRIVGYREDKILEYSLPSQWTSGLGWTAEHAETSMVEHLNRSLSEYRDKLRIEEPCYNPDLRDKLKEEQKQSLRLELMLENALSEDYKPNLLRSSFDLEEDQGLEGENNHEGRRSIESVPLISYVSPSLGRIVSPYTVSCRSEMISTGMSPLSRKGKENRRSGEMVRTHRFSGEKRGAESTKKRWSGDLHSSAKRQRGGDKKRFIPDAEYSQGLGGDLQPTPGIAGQLDEFKNTLEDEMIKSDRFEKLLQAALNP